MKKFHIQMPLELLEHSKAGKEEWDAFVRTSPAGTVFATTVFLDALDARYELWVHRHEGRIDAGLPLVRGILGTYSNPLYCKYLGFLPGPAAGQKYASRMSSYYARVAEFSGLIKMHPTFDYYFHPIIDNWMPFLWLGCRQQTQYTYVIPATKAGKWWDDADSRLRRSVRRGRKSGITVKHSDDAAAIEACYRLSMMPYTTRRSRPLISRQHFVRLAEEVLKMGCGQIWLANTTDGTPVAAALVLEDWRSTYFVFNGTDASAETGTNSMLIAEIIDNAHSRGLDFDFEGSVIQRIESYYRLFGPDLRPYSRIWRPSILNTSKHAAVKWVKRVGGYMR